MRFRIGKYEIKIWYLLLFCIYSNTIMLSSFRLVSYFYVYAIPLFYLVVHVKDVILLFTRARRSLLMLALFFAGIALFGAILSPLINESYDFSFIISGPVKRIVLKLFVLVFLLLVYIRNVSKYNPKVMEFGLYFVFSNLFYVIGTLVICAFPGLHEAILNNTYMDAYTREVSQVSYYYTRIGWSGYSSFLPSAMCSLTVILCVLFAIESKRDGVFNKVNMLFVAMVVGNFCYARTGVIVTAVCIVLYLLYLIKNADLRILSYPVIAFLVIVVFGILVTKSDVVRNWYQWGFAQVISYQQTGSFETDSLSSLKNMYQTLPDGTTSWMLGDGRYSSSTGYYKRVDVGWLRSVFNYGLIFSFFQYLFLLVVLWQFVRSPMLQIKRVERKLLFAMLFILFVVFESKGEVWYNLAGTIIPFCLLELYLKHSIGGELVES